MTKQLIRNDFKRLDYLRPVHEISNVVRLISAHLLLAGWFFFAIQTLPLLWYVLLSIPICLIHQRELSEWIHEASHFNFTRSKKWNDNLILFLAGYFFANDIKVHRFGHNEHHRQLNFFTAEDPDTRLFIVTNKKDWWREIFKDLTGLTAIKMFFDRSGTKCSRPTNSFLLKLFIFQICLLAILYYFKHLEVYIIYYFTLGTLYPLLNRLRLYSQHMEILDIGEYRKSVSSRTIKIGILDSLIFTTDLMRYHHEHHAFPDLPFRALVRIPTNYKSENEFSNRRIGLLQEIYSKLK